MPYSAQEVCRTRTPDTRSTGSSPFRPPAWRSTGIRPATVTAPCGSSAPASGRTARPTGRSDRRGRPAAVTIVLRPGFGLRRCPGAGGAPARLCATGVADVCDEDRARAGAGVRHRPGEGVLHREGRLPPRPRHPSGPVRPGGAVDAARVGLLHRSGRGAAGDRHAVRLPPRPAPGDRRHPRDAIRARAAKPGRSCPSGPGVGVPSCAGGRASVRAPRRPARFGGRRRRARRS